MRARAFDSWWRACKPLFLLAISLNSSPIWPANAEDSAGLKAALHGLGAMGNPSFHHHKNNGIPDNISDLAALPPGVFDVAVINITWAQLQPNPDTLDTTTIGRALDAVRESQGAVETGRAGSGDVQPAHAEYAQRHTDRRGAASHGVPDRFRYNRRSGHRRRPRFGSSRLRYSGVSSNA